MSILGEKTIAIILTPALRLRMFENTNDQVANKDHAAEKRYKNTQTQYSQTNAQTFPRSTKDLLHSSPLGLGSHSLNRAHLSSAQTDGRKRKT